MLLLARILRTVCLSFKNTVGKLRVCPSAASFPCSWRALPMSDVTLPCMTEAVACCHFCHGPTEQTASSLQQILKYLKAVALALLDHSLFWSGQPWS